MINYGEYSELRNKLVNKRIIEWEEDKLILDDGTIVTIEESEQYCCASAGGKFTNVKLDALITNVTDPVVTNIPNDDTIVNEGVVTIFHNQNPVAVAECGADAGNGGYYYSIASLVVKGVHYPVVDA